MKRGDLLELLLAESRENTDMNHQLEQLQEEKKTLLKINAKLRQQLQQKDEELSAVLRTMEQKDAELSAAFQTMKQKDEELDAALHNMQQMHIEIQELRQNVEELREARDLKIEKAADDITDVTLKMRDVFETARKAADLYLAHIEGLSKSSEQQS